MPEPEPNEILVSCLAALTSLVLLATIRGNLLAQQIHQDSDLAVIEGEEPQNNIAEHSFYDDTVPVLQLVMEFLAVAMEMGAGLATHEAAMMSRSLDGEYGSLRRELRGVFRIDPLHLRRVSNQSNKYKDVSTYIRCSTV